nr:MAG TPA_asm: hypothetical protein [Caudoviricetes sp.]
MIDIKFLLYVHPRSQEQDRAGHVNTQYMQRRSCGICYRSSYRLVARSR